MRMRYLLHHVGIWRTSFYSVLLFCFCSPLFWNGLKISLFTIYYFHHFLDPNVYLTLTLSEFEILNDVALYILIINLIVFERVNMEAISLLDQNSNTPFLRNEFSKSFEDCFTITLLTKMTHIYDQTKN